MALLDPVCTVAPSALAVSVDDAKAHLKILHASEDVAIGAFVTAAIAEFEARTGRALMVQTWAAYLDAFPAGRQIVLPRPPFKDLVSIGYIDAAGSAQTLNLASVVTIPSTLGGKIALSPSASWPGTGEHPHAVTLTWRAGLDSADSIDATMKACVLLMTAQKYFNREGPADERRASTATMSSIESLLRLHAVTGWI